MNDYNYINLPPFKWFVLQNFPFIEADFDALTNWQLFCKLGKEINKIISSVNSEGTQIENLTNAFNSLYEYVNNYFDNLDIQEEVDEALDRMAESGELDKVIENYVDYCYIQKEIERIKIYNENGKTNVTIFHIPNKDVNGNNIVLKHGFSSDDTTDTECTETPTEFSKRKNATLCTNASIYTDSISSPNYNKILGLIIHDGEVVTDTREYYPVPRNWLGGSLHFRFKIKWFIKSLCWKFKCRRLNS